MRLRLTCLIAGAAFAALATPAHAAATSDHARAQAALGDIKAAIATVMGAENATATGPGSYTLAAQQAINALVGTGSHQHDSRTSNPGDAEGAIGQVNHLLDRVANPPFITPLHGVLVNLQAAVGNLQDARHAKGLGKYQVASSRALQDLEIAQGRATQYDVLGGMAGAIANTELGVPDGAKIADGCAAPREAGYGLWHGWLVWHAVALGTTSIATDGTSLVRQEGSMLVLYTPAAPMVQHHCATHAAAPAAVTIRPSAARTAPPPARPPARLIEVAAQSAAGKALYTTAQAKAGKAVYATNCASCHGANLQGVAAPAIAGKDFLTTAEKNKYTVSILNTIVTQNMPFNNPASLKPTEYADVMAYLLASNCYPAGKTAFPTNPGSNFGTAPLTTPHDPTGKPDAKGVCAVN